MSETSSQELKEENADLWAADNTSIYVALGQWLKFASCWIKMFWWCRAKGRLVKHDSRWQTTVTNIEMLTLPYLNALLILLVPKLRSSPVLLFVYYWVRCCRMVLSKPIEKLGPFEHKLRMEMTLAHGGKKRSKHERCRNWGGTTKWKVISDTSRPHIVPRTTFDFLKEHLPAET